MSVRLALAFLLSALFCFPCYASSSLTDTSSDALLKGYDIPDLPNPSCRTFRIYYILEI